MALPPHQVTHVTRWVEGSRPITNQMIAIPIVATGRPDVIALPEHLQFGKYLGLAGALTFSTVAGFGLVGVVLASQLDEVEF